MEEVRGGVHEEGVALVLDSIILFSIVIAGSRSRAYRIIERYELSLYMPEEALIEFHRHAERLRRYAIKEFETKAMLAFMLVHSSERALRR